MIPNTTKTNSFIDIPPKVEDAPFNEVIIPR